MHAVEYGWLERIRTVALFAYRLPAADFAPLDDRLHTFVATHAVEPLGPPEPVGDLLDLHAEAGIQLRVLDNLWAFWDFVVASTLGYSGIRLANAAPRAVVQTEPEGACMTMAAMTTRGRCARSASCRRRARRRSTTTGATIEATITLVPPYGPTRLLGLAEFSHIEVIYLFHRVEPDAVHIGSRVPRGNPAWPEVGIFAQRAKFRPNRLGLATCELIAVDGSVLRVRGLDAIDGTPGPRHQALHDRVRATRSRHAARVVTRADGAATTESPSPARRDA